jgi:ribonuclease HII
VFYYERKLKKRGYNLIIGVDEAGRGPLAGPVVAAAVALKSKSFKNRIDDSKKLTSIQREKAFSEIIQKSVFGIGVISEKIIDNFNILMATRRAMEVAVLGLINKLKKTSPKRIHIIVDGNVDLNLDFPLTKVIKGDSKSKTIACASILAKVMRDRIMSLYDKLYPEYGFLQHKGYPTKKHRLLIKRFGPSLIHRKSFLGCVNRI